MAPDCPRSCARGTRARREPRADRPHERRARGRGALAGRGAGAAARGRGRRARRAARRRRGRRPAAAARARRLPDAALLRLVTTLIASEVERVRGPERASEEAAAGSCTRCSSREIADRDDLVARGKELGIALERGGGVVVVRAHPRTPTEDDWRARLLALAERARALDRARRDRSPRARATATRSSCSCPTPTARPAARVAATLLRELEANLSGFAFAVGRSRVAATRSTSIAPATRRCSPRTSSRATRTRRCSPTTTPAPTSCCCPHMSDDPAELKRFYDETVRSSSPTTSSTRLRPRRHARDVPRVRRQRQRDRRAALHPPSHGPLPVRARARDDRARRRLDRRPREASFGLKAMRVLGIARAARPGVRARRRGGRVRREQPDRGLPGRGAGR